MTCIVQLMWAGQRKEWGETTFHIAVCDTQAAAMGKAMLKNGGLLKTRPNAATLNALPERVLRDVRCASRSKGESEVCFVWCFFLVFCKKNLAAF
jgi:hypothetical protein